MSDRTKTGWGVAGVISLLLLVVSASGAIIKASFYLGTIAQDVGHVRVGVERIEGKIENIEARVSALERHRQVLDDVNSMRLKNYVPNP